MIGHLMPGIQERSYFLPAHLPCPVYGNAKPISEIHRWTGFSHYIKVSSGDGNAIDSNYGSCISSALAIALHNTGCIVPAFIECGNSSRPVYTGVLIDAYQPHAETEQRIKMTFLNYIPHSYAKLSSLIEIFKKRCKLKRITPNSNYC